MSRVRWEVLSIILYLGYGYLLVLQFFHLFIYTIIYLLSYQLFQLHCTYLSIYFIHNWPTLNHHWLNTLCLLGCNGKHGTLTNVG